MNQVVECVEKVSVKNIKYDVLSNVESIKVALSLLSLSPLTSLQKAYIHTALIGCDELAQSNAV